MTDNGTPSMRTWREQNLDFAELKAFGYKIWLAQDGWLTIFKGEMFLDSLEIGRERVR